MTIGRRVPVSCRGAAGETLAERIAGRSEGRPYAAPDSRSGRVSTRPIPIEEVPAIARRVAAALDAAHRQGRGTATAELAIQLPANRRLLTAKGLT